MRSEQRGNERVWGGKFGRDVDQPFDEMLPGDIVLIGKHLRKVRRITRRPGNDQVHIAEVVKLRRSGYKSPTRTFWRAELKMFFRGIVAHTDLRTSLLESLLQDEIEQNCEEQCLTERDVVGLLA